MSPLAQVLRQDGLWVGGSDRSRDRGLNRRLFAKLERQGIQLFPQDGSAFPGTIDTVVVSTAVEQDNGDIRAAREHGIPLVHRAELLAGLFNESRGTGIAGTSGKSTVTGMVASILDAAGRLATVVNGGIIRQYVSRTNVGNARRGTSGDLVAEVDESDGSIGRFCPEAGIITNITRDHKELAELQELFEQYASRTSGILAVNGDCSRLQRIRHPRLITFGFGSGNDVVAERISAGPWNSSFHVRGEPYTLSLPGVHNVANALAAIAAATAMQLPPGAIRTGLRRFKGIKRRMELVGRKNGICVIDDFAHNPDKIAAALAALQPMGKRRIIVFQPHGYGPTRFMLHDLAAAFSSALGRSDVLVCLPVYDAGGSADRTVSSRDLLAELQGLRSRYAQSRADALQMLGRIMKPGDVVAVLGARDDTLSSFARQVYRQI